MNPPSNVDVASMFLEMSELLLIQGGEPYRARAFARSAEVIGTTREPLAELVRQGRLSRIAGIGAGSVERVQEMLRTGACAELTRLRARVPGGLRQLLSIRGMGPRTTRLVWHELGITDLVGFEAAAQNGALARVRGIGATTVAQVLADLDERARAPSSKMLLADALALGEGIVAWLKDDPACSDAAQTGSARRRQVVVGDLDFVAGAQDGAAVARRFIASAGVRDVLMRGEGFCIVRLAGGVKADLRIVKPECFGAGVHHFTGDKQHNIALRLYAQKKGLHVSEHGVRQRKSRGRGRLIASGRTEPEVFAALGLPFIPVELRTGGDEIERAARGELPALVDEQDLRGDLHLACDGAEQAVRLAQAALARGLSYGLFVVDHPLLGSSEGRDLESSLRKFEERHAGFAVLVAAMARIEQNGDLTLDEHAAKLADLVCAEPPHADAAIATAAVESALGTGRIGMLMRPMARTLPEETSARTDLWRVLRAAAAARAVVEISGHPRQLDLDGEGARAAMSLGLSMSLGSRARTPAHVTQLRYALWQARRGALGRAQVLNTRDVQGVRAALAGAAAGSSAPKAASGPPTDRQGLARALREPLDDALRFRVEAFLRGARDDELERALRLDHESALQAAFELLAARS